MVRIRLRRVGAKRQPSYRIVVADRESPRDGRFLEIIGHYNPRTVPATVEVEEARLYHWLKHGGQPSESVTQLLKTAGIWSRWERFKGGEAMETLLAEAKASRPAADARTRRDDLGSKRTAKKPKAASAAAAPVSSDEGAAAEA